MTPRCLTLPICLFLLVSPARAAEQGVQVLKTPGGVRFAVLGPKPAKPAPTLFIFATGAEETLKANVFSKIGNLLTKEGGLSVSLDVPCHGKDSKEGEPAGLDGWRKRLEQGEDFTAQFAKKASAVLDYLIKEGYTDEKRVAASGTSRGGFIALHWTAAEPRVGSVVAFAPVADLSVLREFRGLEKHAGTKAQALSGHASKLAGRAVWVCIGNNDERVGTDQLIAFTRKVVAESIAQKKAAPVELHVTATIGHRIHDTAHDEAAAWIARQWRTREPK